MTTDLIAQAVWSVFFVEFFGPISNPKGLNTHYGLI